MIIFSHYHSARIEIRQRDAREWLRKIEGALNFQQNPTAFAYAGGYADERGLIDFDHLNRDMTECHSQALFKSPTAYLRVLDGFEEAMSLYSNEKWQRNYVTWSKHWPQRTHSKISSRIDFYRKKLQGQEYYQSITLQRLEAQRNAVSLRPRLLQAWTRVIDSHASFLCPADKLTIELASR
jgi:hypothetical protein